MTARIAVFAAALFAAAAFTMPATAQLGQGESAKFLKAVSDSKGDDVTSMLEKPGTTIINTRDIGTGDSALHIVVRRGDATYLGYLLSKGADPNLRNRLGETPLLVAAGGRYTDLVAILVKARANVNLSNLQGRTPLIAAVERRNTDVVRELLDAGADPDQKELLGGLSARDYAHQDSRSTVIAQMIDATAKKTRKAVSGPKL